MSADSSDSFTINRTVIQESGVRVAEQGDMFSQKIIQRQDRQYSDRGANSDSGTVYKSERDVWLPERTCWKDAV